MNLVQRDAANASSKLKDASSKTYSRRCSWVSRSHNDGHKRDTSNKRGSYLCLAAVVSWLGILLAPPRVKFSHRHERISSLLIERSVTALPKSATLRHSKEKGQNTKIRCKFKRKSNTFRLLARHGEHRLNRESRKSRKSRNITNREIHDCLQREVLNSRLTTGHGSSTPLREIA